MPELPEVETIARQLGGQITGRVIESVAVRRADIIHGSAKPLGELLPGRKVLTVQRRGKRIIFELTPRLELVFHLGMSGRLSTCALSVDPELHTHLAIRFRGGEFELRFRDPRRFGGVWVVGNGEAQSDRPLRELGPEPLGLQLRVFREMLAKTRQIKALLMDQQTIAGLGNIYCDESLHSAGVHPLVKANALDPAMARRLLQSIKSTLKRAIKFKGTTLVDYRMLDGEEGSFRRHHRVYQREGLPCRTCGSLIRRITAAGRSTFFCPMCQPML